MAAIEKICELSGEYPGYDMYRHKHNHIQVMPKHRKRFRGAIAVLHIFKPELKIARFERGKVWSYSSYDPARMNNYEPPFSSEKEYLDYIKKFDRQRLIKRHSYVLAVSDSDLQGDVDGDYMETTTNLTAVKRRMKRLVRNPNLTIINHDCSYHEWLKSQEL